MSYTYAEPIGATITARSICNGIQISVFDVSKDSYATISVDQGGIIELHEYLSKLVDKK